MNKDKLQSLITELQKHLEETDEVTATAAVQSTTGETEYTDPTQQKAKKSFPLAGNAACSVDLMSGKPTVTITDIETDSTLLGIGVSHVFNPKVSDVCYGANFQLNLYEKLEFVDGLDERFKTPVYTGATGTKYTFNVIYCFTETNDKGEEIKYYLKEEQKEEVTGTDGNYKFNDFTVFPDYMNVGGFAYESDFTSKFTHIAKPAHWIKSGVYHKGFDSKGRLVIIEDDYSHYKLFTYNSSDKITKISDDNGNFLEFTYDTASSQKLQKITDSRGKKIKYTYFSNGLLQKISHYAKDDSCYKTLNLYYSYINAEGTNAYAVSETVCSDTSRSVIEYESLNVVNGKVLSIKHYSKMDSAEREQVSQITFSYDNAANSTDITDENGDCIKYVFNTDGSTKEYYEIKNNLVARAEKYNYVPLEKYEKTVISNEFLNKYKFSEFKSAGVQNSIANAVHEYTETVFNEFNAPKSTTTYNIRVTDNSTKTLHTTYTYTDKHVLRLTTTQETFSDNNVNYPASKSFQYTENRVFNDKDVITEVDTAQYHEGYGYEYDYLDVEKYEYDENGCISKTKRYRKDLYTGSKTDTFYTEKTYNSNKLPVTELDERGLYTTRYYYLDKSNLVNKVMSPIYTYVNYSYDNDDMLNKVSGQGAASEQFANSNSTVYKNGEANATYSGENSNKIEYTYDAKHRPLTVKLNGEIYETYEYNDNVETSTDNYDEVKLTNANSERFSARAYRNGIKDELYAGENLILEHIYDKDGNLTGVTDHLANKSMSISYDTCGNVLSYTEGINKETYTLDVRGQVTQVKHTGDVERTDKYKYIGYATDYVKTVDTGEFTVENYKDLERRYTGKDVYVNETKIDNERVSYLKNGDHGTHIPSVISYKDVTKLEYTYDYNGNISEIKKDGEIISRYKYDYLNRLMREDSKALNLTYCYTYDEHGNISKKQIYQFTLSEYLTTTYSEKCYVYDGHGRLKYNYYSDRIGDEYEFMSEDDPVTYDSMGNPLKWSNGNMVWTRGRKLIRYGNNTFEYDAQGRRTKKNNITFTYDSQGRLIKQSNGVEFFYDTTGLLGFTYQNATYYYRKDIQGNIIAILDSTGAVVVEYDYDAWGRFSVSGNFNLGYTVNPFKYRGYYYDNETALYYLESRYYDQRLCRFINADDIHYADPTYLNGLNLYAYCNNNPVRYLKYIVRNTTLNSISFGNYINGISGDVSEITVDNSVKVNSASKLSFSVALTDRIKNKHPCSWISAKGIYASGGLGVDISNDGFAFASIKAGIASFTLTSPKFFSGLSADSIFNPNIYLEVATIEANASIGIGLSANISLLSAEAGVGLGNDCKFSIKGYVGYGIVFDFSNGFSIGCNIGFLPFGFEIKLSVGVPNNGTTPRPSFRGR